MRIIHNIVLFLHDIVLVGKNMSIQGVPTMFIKNREKVYFIVHKKYILEKKTA